VIELLSPSDSLKVIQGKMQEYQDNRVVLQNFVSQKNLLQGSSYAATPPKTLAINLTWSRTAPLAAP